MDFFRDYFQNCGCERFASYYGNFASVAITRLEFVACEDASKYTSTDEIFSKKERKKMVMLRKKFAIDTYTRIWRAVFRDLRSPARPCRAQLILFHVMQGDQLIH